MDSERIARLFGRVEGLTCFACSAALDPKDASYRGRDGENHFVAVSCGSCRAPFVFAMVLDGERDAAAALAEHAVRVGDIEAALRALAADADALLQQERTTQRPGASVR